MFCYFDLDQEEDRKHSSDRTKINFKDVIKSPQGDEGVGYEWIIIEPAVSAIV